MIVKPSSVDKESPFVNGGRARQGVATEVGHPDASPVMEVDIIVDLETLPKRHAERRRPRVQEPIVAFPSAAQAGALRVVKPKVEPKKLLRVADSKRRKKRHEESCREKGGNEVGGKAKTKSKAHLEPKWPPGGPHE